MRVPSTDLQPQQAVPSRQQAAGRDDAEADFVTGFPRPAVPTLWSPGLERDSCGVALLAHVGGQPSRTIVQDALTALARMAHRGAKGCDGAEDGVGIMLALPDRFFRSSDVMASIHAPDTMASADRLPPEGQYAVGMMFLPRHDEERWTAQLLVEKVVARAARLRFLGWRRVPVDDAALGHGPAARNAPSVWQFFVVSSSVGVRRPEDSKEFGTRLFWVSKQIERLGKRFVKEETESGARTPLLFRKWKTIS